LSANVFDIVRPPSSPSDTQAERKPVDTENVLAKLTAIQREVRRRRWLADPVAWATERLGDTVWSKQAEILRSVRDRRKTAVQSCHEIGKSYIASVTVGWFLDVNRPGEAFVVTSAPTAAQVRAILWREIGRVHARGGLRGRVTQTEWHMPGAAGNEELVAFGRKPDDYDPTAFQGIHAPKVLVVFDEACGIPEALFEAADSLIANDAGKALAIGNPDDPETFFREICTPGSGWNCIPVGAFDSPNFTGEPMPQRVLDQLIGKVYVEEKRRKWAPHWFWVNRTGERVEVPDDGPVPAEAVSVVAPEDRPKIEDTNPLWQSKVCGVFPPNSTEGGLIPLSWIRLAQQRTLKAEGPSELGVDVGGGGDTSTIAHRRGPVVRIVHESNTPDTMETCGHVVAKLKSLRASRAKIDVIGIGRGVVDRGKELTLPFLGINVGGAPQLKEDPETGEDEEKLFVNLRAQLWWNVRNLFEQGRIDIDPTDEDLAAELASIRFKRNSNGKIQVESKDDLKKRDLPSPNRADALMLALAPDYIEDISWEPVWGRKRKKGRAA
jgi:hypothetical protein